MDLSKLLFGFMVAATVTVLPFLAGVYSAIHENAAYRSIGVLYSAVKNAFAAFSETSILVPEHFLQPSRKVGEGVLVNSREDDDSLILFSGFFDGGTELRLLRRDGSVVHRWPVRFSKIFPDAEHMARPPATDWNIDLHGALILPDGSPVFNFEYGGLVKLDRCGSVQWTLAHETHHSVERAEGGGFWVPGQRTITEGKSAFPPYPTPYREDLILKVTDDGLIDLEISVPALLYANGMAPLLTATGADFARDMAWDGELVHLNKVAELTSDRAAHFPEFKAGDLLLSLREQNLLLVLDPALRSVKWWQIGPWVRQHDPEFNKDGTLTVFNNNAYRTALLDKDRTDLTAPRDTNILRFDPSTRASTIAFGGRPGQEMLSVVRGKHEPTINGGFLITETEAGRVLEADASGQIVWEYINRYDADNVAEITEARVYPATYFSVSDWSCGSQPNG